MKLPKLRVGFVGFGEVNTPREVVSAVRKKGFRIWIIPHTYEVTNLREKTVGDAVNLEADLVGKYVAKLLTGQG